MLQLVYISIQYVYTFLFVYIYISCKKAGGNFIQQSYYFERLKFLLLFLHFCVVFVHLRDLFFMT